MSLRQMRSPTIQVIVARTDEELCAWGLHCFVETLQQRPDAVISLTTGRTTAGLYRTVREWHARGQTNLSPARFVSSEEYVGIGADDPISLFGWLRHEVLDPLGVSGYSAIRMSGNAADLGNEWRRFDATIEQMGGVDLVIQSIGANGHFGFNEPGVTRDAPSRVVTLAPSTVRSNAAYWPPDIQVPTRGLTMGVDATLRARHILLLAAGATKAEAIARAVQGPIDEDAPCSLLRLAPRLTIIADEAAAARLDGAGNWHT